MLSSTLLTCLFTLTGVATANPLLNFGKRDACSGNTADDRSTWCDYSTDTDYYTDVPDTGVTREYYLSVEEATVSPDGYSRYAQTINGSLPGPTLIGDWGDTFVVHVINNLPDSSGNGTSIHFHGIRQNYTNDMDGVVSVTQCPLTPGDTQTYTWRATQYGSSWYHSHFAVQAWEGVFGGILINGPATADYDEDMGILFLNDWSHETVDELWYQAEEHGSPTMDNALINGTNVYGDDDSDDQTGSRFETAFTSGDSYRFRLVNGAIDTFFRFSIDNHTLTVISTDFVPITPYETTSVGLGPGQRYDIVVTADQADIADNFWMRATPQIACSDNDSTDNIKGIVYYGDSAGTPTTTGYDITDSCADESVSDLVPYLSKTAGSSATYSEDDEITLGQDSTETYFRWYIAGSTFQVEWADPTLSQVYSNASSYTSTSNVYEVPEANDWVYLIIENQTPLAHPIHLHGHDFFILAQGTDGYNSSVALSTDNPPRRDVAMLAADPGYLVLAFETDNPGAWLAHCHIGWHVAEGFALQFVERKSEIAALMDYDSLNSTCTAWSDYATSYSVVDTDSGV